MLLTQKFNQLKVCFKKIYIMLYKLMYQEEVRLIKPNIFQIMFQDQLNITKVENQGMIYIIRFFINEII
jgi:hypothetical protein